MTPLRRIEKELMELSANADEGFPIDPFVVGVLARKVGVQAEMVEQGLVE